MANIEDNDVTADDLLEFEQGQLTQFVQQRRIATGEFGDPDVAGLGRLPWSRRKELRDKLSTAADHIDASKPLDVDSLAARLTHVVAEQNDRDYSIPSYQSTPPNERNILSPSTDRTCPPSPSPEPDQENHQEVAAYHALIRCGGRPVYSLPDHPKLWKDHKTGIKLMWRWLKDPTATDQSKDMQCVLKRQYDRWWDFRKWQWNNRGLGDSEEGLSTWMTERHLYDQFRGRKRETPGHLKHWKKVNRDKWMHKSTELQLSKGSTFAAYVHMVKACLHQYGFKRRLRLRKDPRHQDKWSTWLEYLNYELWSSKQLAKRAEASELKYRRAWETFEQLRMKFRKVGGCYRWQCPLLDSARAMTAFCPSKEELDTLKEDIETFSQDTKQYREVETAAYSQRKRVRWARLEAVALELELSQEDERLKNQSQLGAKHGKKRRSITELEALDKGWSKKARVGHEESVDVPDTFPGQPRRSRRLQHRKSE